MIQRNNALRVMAFGVQSLSRISVIFQISKKHEIKIFLAVVLPDKSIND